MTSSSTQQPTPYRPNVDDIENWLEAQKQEDLMDFTEETLKARMHYAETPSDDARFAFAYYLLKSKVRAERQQKSLYMYLSLGSDLICCGILLRSKNWT